jgi:hypothetical protein
MSTCSLFSHVKRCSVQTYIRKGSFYLQIFYIFMNRDLSTPPSYINRLNILDDIGTRNGCIEVVRRLLSKLKKRLCNKFLRPMANREIFTEIIGFNLSKIALFDNSNLLMVIIYVTSALTYTHTYTHIHIHTYKQAHKHTHTYIYAHTHTRTHI